MAILHNCQVNYLRDYHVLDHIYLYRLVSSCYCYCLCGVLSSVYRVPHFLVIAFTQLVIAQLITKKMVDAYSTRMHCGWKSL